MGRRTRPDPTGSGPRGPQPPEDRIAELEAQLAEARRRIDLAQRELQRQSGNLDRIVLERTAALADKAAELDRVNALKSEFISIAGHELRTPMTAVLGYAEMISEQKICPLPPQLVRPVAALTRNARRLRRLIDEMLDVSRLESGRLVLHLDRHDVADLARAALAELESYAAQKELHLHLEERGGPEVLVDGNKIQQVVVNLVANAIKQVERGGQVVVQAGVEGDLAYIRVRDDGGGLPPGVRERLFQPFSNDTAKHHTSNSPDSAGLGLYIARGIVVLHGGDIEVTSEEGKGTELVVTLPVAGPA